MVALGDKEITIGGYAIFFEEWFDEGIRNREINHGLFSGLQFSETHKGQMFDKIRIFE
jgi:hypothetical protein